MLSAAAFCPHPPLLLRELGGRADPVAELRAVVVAAVREVVTGRDRVVVVAPVDDPSAPTVDPYDLRRLGTARPPTGSRTELSVGVARRLLDEAGWTGPVEVVPVPWDLPEEEVDALAGRVVSGPSSDALLVLADGGARRGQAAPGYLDERAFGFDDDLAAALADGDARALRDLDADLARELMVQGRTPYRVLGAAALAALPDGAKPRARLAHRSDPFGVTYLVGTWRF